MAGDPSMWAGFPEIPEMFLAIPYRRRKWHQMAQMG
jgi:hypothetical protein